MEYGLRPAVPADGPLLLQIFLEDRRAEFAPLGWPPAALDAFLATQFDLRERHYLAAYAEAARSVVTYRGRDVGTLLVARAPGGLHVVNVALLAAERGLGIGTAVLRDLQREASKGGMSLTLTVREGNPARRLYERLGFGYVRTDGPDLPMAWSPAPAQELNTAS
jgi:ribosomal protein S18 acetylase RimI-like enzyme